MAQLKDTVVSGNLRVTDTVLADVVQTDAIKTHSASGSDTISTGTDGQILKTNGTNTYWGSVTLDNVADGSTRKLEDYLPLSGGTITGNLTTNGTLTCNTVLVPSGAASATDTTKGINLSYSGNTAHIGLSSLLGIYSSGNIVIRPNGASSSAAGNGSIELSSNGVNVTEIITAEGFKKSGGTSSQFLKADGSVDSTVYAPLASPALTGTPIAPTASAGTNTTQIATTAFVTSAVSTAVGSVYKVKGTKANYASLPSSGNVAGDVWNVTAAYNNYPAGTNWVWTGSEWDALGGSIDLSVKQDTLVSGTNIKTVNNNSLLGSGNISIATPGTLNTNNTSAQAVNGSEALSGTVKLHKIAKTGTYSDLIGKPTVDSTPTQNSSNLVSSGGVYTALGSYALSADIVALTNAEIDTIWSNAS